MNNKHALELANKLNQIDKKFFTNKMKEIDSPKQVNNFDCGIYVILYIVKITEKIINKENTNKLKIEPKEAGEYRKLLKECINYERNIKKGNKIYIIITRWRG